ncbi:hypothetical protein B0H19DRAFT_371052 [Mycena capillaripes]|nr:hypothetical protein B0H19DRAFT_371052 [Mycena capillaripes]
MRQTSVCGRNRGGPDALSEGPAGAAFHWGEIRNFCEFKQKDIPQPRWRGESSKATTSRRSGGPLACSSFSSASSHISPSILSLPPILSLPAKRAADIPAQDTDSRKRVKRENPRLQCTSSALKLLAYGGLRSHVISVFVSRSWLELLYYDHSVVVKSQPLQFTEDPTLFLSILFAFGSISAAGRGYPTLSPPPSLEDPSLDLFLEIDKNWVCRIIENRHLSHGIIGRGTVVSLASVISAKDNGKNVILKWSWGQTSRTFEARIIEKAVQLAPTQLRLHLPYILHYKEVSEMSPPFHHRLLTLLGSDVYEMRIFRLLVMEPLLPISELGDEASLKGALQGIFNAYCWLVETAKILHRDLSIKNLMYRVVDGRVYGVLNNFDLAQDLDIDTGSISKQRTGTGPFIALDLFVPSPPVHLVRHDLESFFYVVLFLTVEENRSLFAAWSRLPMEQLKNAKAAALRAQLPPLKGQFKGFRLWLLDLKRILQNGFRARVDHQFALELSKLGRPAPATFYEQTLGGHVTLDTFSSVVNCPSLSP